MHKQDFIRVSQGLKGKAFAAIIIGLCTIVSFFPQTAEPATFSSSALSALPGSNGVATLPARFQIEGESCAVSGYDNVPGRTAPAQSKEGSFQKYGPATANAWSNHNCVAYSNNCRGADFTVACQLLNIPPPCTLL
jgi:hypothetical protein